ncbi:hypothetical protein GCM10011351_01090 [Paraliobacillus quinghaiensis]|uniref:Uncharacterized protein n=1 Tax=Paraliobacillus quinghaiensis TaxID=470815 RepID=A0A917TDR0_9BACI|nr:hypothetical protein [Paraliobacillus quinghaiensis]GGM19066.1 hypothetical protein GCM10011351_01090 [Paraliobacillus quinghaiensis]
MSQEQRMNDVKAMQWFGYIIVILSLLVEVNIIRPENGPGPILGFSYLASTGIVAGATITFIYTFIEKKRKN